MKAAKINNSLQTEVVLNAIHVLNEAIQKCVNHLLAKTMSAF
jgi:hypothetical protein